VILGRSRIQTTCAFGLDLRGAELDWEFVFGECLGLVFRCFLSVLLVLSVPTPVLALVDSADSDLGESGAFVGS